MSIDPTQAMGMAINTLIHDASRLRIMSVITSTGSISFTDITSICGFTPGNLGSHLEKLETAGYITIRKEVSARRPAVSIIHITKRGRDAYQKYIDHWDAITRSSRTQGR